MSKTVDLTKLRVVDLRKMLKKHGLSTSGRKAQLIARLQQQMSNGNECSTEEEEEEKKAPKPRRSKRRR